MLIYYYPTFNATLLLLSFKVILDRIRITLTVMACYTQLKLSSCYGF